MIRAIVVFLLGIGFACGTYYSGAWQWATDRWQGYWNSPVAAVPVGAPVPVAETPPPVSPAYPTPAQYPGPESYPTPGPGPAPYPVPAPDAPPPAVGGPAYGPPPAVGGPEYGPPPEDEGPEGAAPSYQPSDGGPPLSVQPVDGGPPVSLHVAIGYRAADSGDCLPAYIVVNDTHRPVFLTQRERGRGYGPPERDKTLLQPGERRVACAADVYRPRLGYRRFDYYRQNAWYGPDAIDVPPPVVIRVTD